ncbi:MAG: DUF58 domain-containing protein [Pseudomonadales bacterium]|nr:DUF58 domain-containing protein [Pseudomonadales bacterium]
MRLSLRFLALAGIVVLLAVAAFWGAEPLGLWRWSVLLLAAALAWEWWEARNLPLRLGLSAERTPRLGVPTRVRVELDAERPVRARHRLVGSEGLHATSGDGRFDLAIRGGQPPVDGPASYDAEVLPVRLGPTTLGAQWLELAGALGLGYWQRRLPVEEALRVAPARLADRIGTPGSAPLGGRRRPRAGHGAEVFALREQRPGDSAARIDWKATARRARPVIRETEAEEQLELVLVLDAGLGAGIVQGPLTRFGHAANVAARLAEYAELHGDRSGLLVYADRVLVRVPVGRGRAQLERIRGALGGADARSRESNPLAAMLEVRAMVRHRALVVVFADLDDADAAGQLVAATRLLRPVHLPLVAAIRDEESEALAQRRPEGWRDPWYALAVEELDRVAEGTRLRLQRLGAEVVHTHADELDGALRRRYARLRREHRV